ncbi:MULTISPECIES: hypothetical protein [Rhizobium]|uniref:JmjC domain-containing protein n=1 Tax=Rhizobium soli TaxID=424798 RepID=A0A7X0MSA8_9HYPH|nr:MULTISPECIES: hypothetical protein [Rhizobium]MBB6509792.1 hypothetical protein [Rhizobium soli]SEH29811.1 hypothetical protein SAMN03159407_3875 [Rhizobium sp. NFR12]
MNSMLMNKDIIANWEDRHARLFGNEIVKLNHRLLETGLFSREAVGKLIERCPDSEFGLESMSDDITNPSRLYGVRNGISGAEALAAVEKGRMWMNIRRVMDWAPEYGRLLDTIFSEFAGRMPGFETFKRNLGVLVSSPNANVFYHADIQGQSLWQIEGSKRVYLYPRSEVFLRPMQVEKILLRETDEKMPYETWFDEYATAVDLHPGEMVTWPLYAPHRVQNHDCMNISVTMEHWTKQIWNSYAVHYGNGVFRRTLGVKGLSTENSGLHVYPKAVAAFAWKKAGKQKKGDVVVKRDFKLDASAEGGRVALT